MHPEIVYYCKCTLPYCGVLEMHLNPIIDDYEEIRWVSHDLGFYLVSYQNDLGVLDSFQVI